MRKDTSLKKYNIKGSSEVISALAEALVKKGTVRLVHFGIFRVVQVKGRKRFDFKTRKMVDMKPFKQVTFTPADGLRAMINSS